MSNKPRRSNESVSDRMKKLALWQWGLITIIASPLVYVMLAAGRPTHRLSAQERAELYGVYAGVALLLVAGIVMVVLHVVRRKKP